MQAVGYIDTTGARSISCTLRLKSSSPMLTTQTYSEYNFTQAYQHQNKGFNKNHDKSCEEDTSFFIKLSPVEHQNIQSDHHHYLYH
jgi:hypothetical protein